jgi:hypothetical protein
LKLLNILEGLQVLLQFYLPLVFRIGYLVRCCTWEGKPRASGDTAKHVLQEVLITLVHLLNDVHAKNEYVRTLAVALMTWTPFFQDCQLVVLQKNLVRHFCQGWVTDVRLTVIFMDMRQPSICFSPFPIQVNCRKGREVL